MGDPSLVGSSTSDGDLYSRVSSRTESSVGARITTDQVGQFLLSRNFYLTALELLVECEESGNEQEATLLRDFFRDTTKFDPNELARFQGEDALSTQALAREREEKLSLAEYELRLAQEDIKELKERIERLNGQLVDAAASGKAVGNETGSSQDIPILDDQDDPDAGPSKREIHQFNGAILAHLKRFGYRVTAMTLQEEAQAQIEPAMAGTLPIWQFYKGAQAHQNAKEVAEAALKEQAALQERLNEVQWRFRGMQEKYEATHRENQMLRSDIHVLEQKLESYRTEHPTSHAADANVVSTRGNTELSDGAAGASGRAHTGRVDEQDIRPRTPEGDGVFGGVFGAEGALRVVGNALPKIVPNVLINKREELVPVIIALVQEHPEPDKRDQLCSLLFNLVKRPNPGQRKVIVDGCVQLAKGIGVRRTAEELLPQCWEQVSHKYSERRTLVAEAVGALVDHIADDMRCSLVVSILRQLCGDNDAEVRQAAVKSLTRVLSVMDGLEKYRVFEEVLMELVMDHSDQVTSIVQREFLPVFLAWVRDSNKLYVDLVPNILQSLHSIIDESPFAVGTDHMLIVRGEAELHTPREVHQQKCLSLINLYSKLLPLLRSNALKSRPEWASTRSDEADECGSGGSSDARKNEVLEASSSKEDNVNSNPFMDGPITPTQSAGNVQVTSNPFIEPGDVKVDGQDKRPVAGTNPFVEADASTCSTNPFLDDAAVNPAQTNPFLEPNSADMDSQTESQKSLLPPTASGSVSGQEDLSGLDNLPDNGTGVISEAEANEIFGRWVEVSDHQEWVVMEIVAERVVGLLLKCVRKVAPVHECKKLRKRLASAIKLTCGTFGEIFTSRVIEPQFVASAGIPPLPSAPVLPDHVIEIVRKLKPETAEASRVGRACVLPVLLAGVLTQAGKGRLTSHVRNLLAETSRNDTWVLQHKQEFVKAIQFGGLFSEVVLQLQVLLRDSVKSPSLAVKRGAGVLAEGMVASASPSQTLQTILPNIVTLSLYSNTSVQLSAVEAMECLAIHCAARSEVIDKLHGHWDKLVTDGSHEVQLAVVRAMTAAAASAPVHIEFLLKQILLLLARIHQKSVAGKSYLQLQETASAAFLALRTLDGCNIEDHKVRLHLVAAMDSLTREAQLLDTTKRQLLSAMLKDQSENTPVLRVPQKAQKPVMPSTPKADTDGMDSTDSRQVEMGHRASGSRDGDVVVSLGSDSTSSRNSNVQIDPTNPFLQ